MTLKTYNVTQVSPTFVNPFYVLDQLSVKTKECEIKERKSQTTKMVNLKKQRIAVGDVEIARTKKIVEGDEILQNSRRILWKSDLNIHQLTLSEIYTQANIENIYRRDFKENEVRIKLENNISEFRPYAFVSMPRRNGKTYGTSAYVAAALVFYRNFHVKIFAPTLKQTEIFRDMVLAHLYNFMEAGVEFEIVRKNPRGLSVRPKGSIEINTLVCLPTTVNTVRGVGANMIVADELSFISNNFVLKMLLPLLTVNKTSLAGISTADGADNHFFKFLSMHNPNDPTCPVNAYQFFDACFECRVKKIHNTCKHLLNEKPTWISEERSTNVKKMYKALGGEELCDQEIGGLIQKTKRNAFNTDMINDLFGESNIITESWFTKDVEDVYSFIDPTGGGASDLAIITAVYENGNFIFVGIELIHGTRPSDCFYEILQHYKTIKSMKLFKNSNLRVTIEGNTPWSFNDIADLLLASNIEKLHIMDGSSMSVASTVLGSTQRLDDNVKKPETRDHTKAEMYIQFSEHLKQRRIKFINTLVTIKHPRADEPEKSARDLVRDILRKQFDNYCVVVQESMNVAFHPAKITFSGKIQHGKSKDDGVTGSQLCLLYILKYLKKKY